MKEFYSSFGFILSFMALELIIGMTFGEKFVEWFLLLVLFSMVLINSDTFISFFNDKFLKA